MDLLRYIHDVYSASWLLIRPHGSVHGRWLLEFTLQSVPSLTEPLG
jgi:hypothetical protein